MNRTLYLAGVTAYAAAAFSVLAVTRHASAVNEPVRAHAPRVHPAVVQGLPPAHPICPALPRQGDSAQPTPRAKAVITT